MPDTGMFINTYRYLCACLLAGNVVFICLGFLLDCEAGVFGCGVGVSGAGAKSDLTSVSARAGFSAESRCSPVATRVCSFLKRSWSSLPSILNR